MCTIYGLLKIDFVELIDVTKTYLKTGEFVTVKIADAVDFDLYAESIN